MNRSKRRLLLFALLLVPTILLLTFLYQAGMALLEGEPRTFWRSLMTVVETLTTTGYGQDAEWRHPVMNLYVITLQIMGVVIFFLIFPVYLLPYMEERFEARIPSRVTGLEGHIVIYEYGPAVASLCHELLAAEVPFVIVEESETEARRLQERGMRVVHRGLEEDALEGVGLLGARALIANAGDDQNAAVVLAARQMGFQGEVLAMVEDARHRQPLVLAGATAVFDPRHILGASLAAQVSQKLNPTVAGLQQMGSRLQIWEVRVAPDSPLAGSTLQESGVAADTGATVIGVWKRGRLVPSPGADVRIQAHDLLVAAGAREGMEKLRDLAGPARPLMREGYFVVAGAGEVGRKVVQVLRDAGEEVRVVDRLRIEGVDLVGDVLDPDTLGRIGVEGAQAVVLALDTDSATLFATVIVRDITPDVPVAARVNAAANLQRIHRAGADFALSISVLAGQMLARRLLGQETVAIDPQLKVQRIEVEETFVDRRPGELGIRQRSGCSVVGVERGEEISTGLGADFRFHRGDALFVCGSGEDLRRFREVFPRP